MLFGKRGLAAADVVLAELRQEAHGSARTTRAAVRPPVHPGRHSAPAPRAHKIGDEHVGPGGNLASLRGHMEAAGRHIVLATTSSANPRSELLAFPPATRQDLWGKHGAPLERCWQQTFGFGLDPLTEAKAGYLVRTPSFDFIRDRMAEA